MSNGINKFVSTRSSATRQSAGIAYVIVPSNIERDDYIKNCYLKNTLTISFENGGILEEVSILNHVFNELYFPKTSDQLGSLVFWVNVPKLETLVIVGCLNKNNELSNLNENQFSLKRKLNGNFVEILGNSSNGTLLINVQGEGNNGKLNVEIVNDKSTAELNLIVKGNVNFDVVGETVVNNTKKLEFNIKDLSKDKKNTIIKYEKQKGFTYKDEFDNEINLNQSNIQIKANVKINLGQGKEPVVLGRTQNQMLTQILTLLGSTVVTTMLGPQSLSTQSSFIQMIPKLQQTLSQYTFTD